MEGVGVRRQVVMWVVLGMWMAVVMSGVEGLRFVIDKKECWQHEVPFDGDEVHVSYVVIQSEYTWSFGSDNVAGLDMTVEGPGGHHVHSAKDKTEEKFSFIAHRKGMYKFCFFNRNTMQETLDFDVHIGYHITPLSVDEHVKDEHFKPLMKQIEKLEESLYSIAFEQHYLLAQTDHQIIVNKSMSRRFVYKAILEAAALIGCSVLQVVLLRRLFERKLGFSRV